MQPGGVTLSPGCRGATLEDKLDNSYVSLTLLQLASCEGDEVAAHTVLRAGADANR